MANLPDPVIEQIFHRLTTSKAAVRLSFMSKQCEGILSSLPILNFDERHNDNAITGHKSFTQHKSFIRNLERYLELIKEKGRRAEKTTPSVKLRLHMTRYSSRDARVVSKLLSSSMETSVLELDISLGGATLNKRYYLSRANFMNMKTLTTLNLEKVRMNNIYDPSVSLDFSISPCLLPCLKTMSFKHVQFELHALQTLVVECPCIEHLSLDSCSFKSSREFELYVKSQSLISLEIKHCNTSKAELDVENLESLTIVSSELKTLKLERCFELKHVNISAQCLEEFSIHAECNAKAIIDAPALQTMRLTSYLGFRFSLNTPRLRDAFIEPLFHKEELPSWGPWKHFPELKDFLMQFVSCENMKLYAKDFRDLIFPKDFRMTVASPMLLDLDDLEYGFPNRPKTYEDSRDLGEALSWMAPNVMAPCYTNY